jgi:hypothetical protein
MEFLEEKAVLKEEQVLLQEQLVLEGLKHQRMRQLERRNN